MAKGHFVKFEEKVWHECGKDKYYDYAHKWINASHVQYVSSNSNEGVKIYLMGRNTPIEVFGYAEDIIKELEDAL